jgi:hypothetical protein
MQLATHQHSAIAMIRATEAAYHTLDASGAIVHSRIGWFTDPPGAGKTRVIIEVTSGPAPVPRGVSYSTSAGDLVSATIHRPPPEGTTLETTIVVVPPSIVAQWESELSAAQVGYFPIRLVAHVATFVQRIVANDLPRVTLVCSTRYPEVCEALAGYVPVRLVLDEAPRLKLTAHSITARFTWLVSAAPEVASVHDLIPRGTRTYWALLRLLPIATLRQLVVRNADQTIVYPCSVVERRHVCAGDAAVLLVMRSYVGASVRARLDANDVQGALLELGAGSGDDLMTVVRRRIDSDAEETGLLIRQVGIQLLRLAGPAHERATAYLARLRERLERLHRDAHSADARFADALHSDCVICHSTLEHPVLVQCCQNLFCAVCILSWTQRNVAAVSTCPACRAPNVQMVRISVPGETADAETPAPAGTLAPATAPATATPQVQSKTETILAIIAAAVSGVLLYSDNVSGMYAIRNKLEEAGIVHGELRGRSTTRDKALRVFRDGGVKVLFLNAGENCAGIDLPGVSDIILYHAMSPSTYTQIVGRGKRICRTEPLAVHSLVLADDEMNERPI